MHPEHSPNPNSNSAESAGAEDSKASKRVFARPFLWVALCWAALGVGVSAITDSGGEHGLAWLWGFGILWVLSLLDFYLIGKVVASLLSLVAENHSVNRSALVFRTILWGFAKLNVFALFALVFVFGDSIPGTPLLLGTSTLVVVPIVGGLWWSAKRSPDLGGDS